MVCDLIVERLLGPDAPLVVPVDDTLLKRRGRKVHGTFWHHDATANSRGGAVAWGNNWVTAGINVKLAFLERTVCLLVLFRLWRPRRKEIAKGKPDPLRPSKPHLARELLCLLAERFQARMIHMVGDAAYASGAFAGLPANVTITSRLRADAALNRLAPPRPPEGQRKRGRPAKKGPRLGKLSQIALDPATEWVKSPVCRYAKTEQAMVHAFQCLWYEAFAQQPVQVILIKDDSKPQGYELALIATDLKATPRAADRTLRTPLADRGRLRRRQTSRRRRRGSQPDQERRRADRPVPVHLHDPHDHLVRALRPRPRRRRLPPPALPLVSHQDHPLLRRHARQAPTRNTGAAFRRF